jgi:hypothetical protein
LQRYPRNSVEQLGQIDEASLIGFAGTPAAVFSTPAAVVEPGDLTGKFRDELMHRVVAQIQSQEKLLENTNVP